MFNFGLFISYAAIVSFTPGPNNIMSLYNASQKGFKKNIEFTLGVSSGFFVVMIFCSFFNYWLNNVLPTIQPFMSILGASYMMYLAFKIFKSKPPKDVGSTDKVIINFKTGFMIQFVNPKAILYGITIVSSFIMPYFTSWIILVLFSTFLAFVALLSTSSWALFGSLFTKILTKYYKLFNLVMSGLLIYTALTIAGIIH